MKPDRPDTRLTGTEIGWPSGEFVDPAVEYEFRALRHDDSLLHYKLVAGLLILTMPLYAWTAIAGMGIDQRIYQVLGLRGLVTVLAVVCLYACYRRWSHVALDRLYIVTVAITLAVQASSLGRAEPTSTIAIVHGLMVLSAAHIFFPGRSIALVPFLLIYSVSLGWTYFHHFELRPADRIGLVTWLVVANMIGVFVAYRLNRHRREAYLAIREQAAALADLKTAREEADTARALAEQASRAKSNMLANTSHELRTPLNAIIGFSQMIATEVLGPIEEQRYRQYANDIVDSGRHLLELIDDLLDLSKIEAGKIELRPKWFSPMDVAQNCHHLLSTRAMAGGVTLDMRLDRTTPGIFADERAVTQILVNLISNGIKFTDPGGRVHVVAVRTEGGGLRISVEDTGLGMTSEDIAQALRPFEQVDNLLTRRAKGWGLGLSIVRALVDMHDATMSIDSEPGKGTRVHVDFPPERVMPEIATLRHG
ncbi:MAG: ATP-binding protein [Pseudomonadota bacterium]|nr:ATP-binding protein [Pseudomonadota bacterium]